MDTSGILILWMVGIVGRTKYLVIEADAGESIQEGLANLFDALPEKAIVFSLAIIQISEGQPEKKKESLLKRVT